MPLVKRHGRPPNEEAYEYVLELKSKDPMISATKLKKSLIAKFGMSERTARVLVYRVYNDLAEVEGEVRPFRKQRIRAVIEATISHCMKKSIEDGEHKYLSPLLRAVQELAKVDGLYSPEQLEVKSSHTPVDNMTNVEKRAELNEILKKYQDKGIDVLGTNTFEN